MQIALFHTTLPQPDRKPGGVAVAVDRLANALVKIGNEVTVYSLTDAPEDHRYAHERVLDDAPVGPRSRLARLLLLPALLNGFSFNQHDVLHLHGDDWFYLSRSIPTIRTFHGSALEEAQSADHWARALEQLFVYPLEHLADHMATLSAAVGPRTARIYDTPHLADNGVNRNTFHPGPKTPTPSVVYIGTWDGRKRGRFLYQTFVEEVLPQVPGARLHMVSDACPSHDQVVHHDRPNDEELAALYRKAWVFAYPSRYEGFGIPYLEAMASGTAVLTSPNQGARYVLDDGTYGVVSEDESFGTDLIRLLQDSDRRETLVRRGLERTRAFSWTSVAERHETLYRQAVRRSEHHEDAVPAGL